MKKKKTEPIKEVDEMITKTGIKEAELSTAQLVHAVPITEDMIGEKVPAPELAKPVNPAVAVLGDGCRCHVCKNWFALKDVKTEEFKRINFLFIHLWKARGYVCRNCRRD